MNQRSASQWCCVTWRVDLSSTCAISSYCCSWSTMYEIVWDPVYAINQCCALDMRFPQTQAECASAAAGFTATICKNSPLRYVVGAVDGLFIKRNARRLSETLHVQRYFNGHKMGFGLNLQAACDHSLRFIGVFCGGRCRAVWCIHCGAGQLPSARTQHDPVLVSVICT